MLKILHAADIRQAKTQRKVGVIYGLQNAAMVGDRADRIDIFADLGVRIIQLTYNAPTQLGGGALAPGDPGLTRLGRAVVERLNDRRVIVDLSHSGRQLCLDAVEASRQPICITHTGCRAIADVPRNKSDLELRRVAERGGYVGIYFVPFVAPGRTYDSSDVAAHIEHAINICGEDHVGIGSDYGIPALRDTARARQAWAIGLAQRRASGISAPGEDPRFLPFADDLTGPDQFRVLAGRLVSRGHGWSRIEKILGLNFLRYTEEVWGG